MQINKEFTKCHPFINFYFFVFVIVTSMFFMHPVFIIISFITSFTYSVYLKGTKALKYNIYVFLPLLIIVAVINPIFNHAGVTILFYLFGGNPITLEAIIYGVMSSIMFITVLMWFSSYNEIMTSDKFIYIFGKIIPGLSLIFSMVLRFVPRFKNQIKVICNTQKIIGRDLLEGSIIKRAKNGIKVLSILITWALENSIDTADSMKARGYGLKERSSFSIFTFQKRDKFIMSFMIIFSLIVILGKIYGTNRVIYYPQIKISRNTILSIVVDISYFIFCIIPMSVDIFEEVRWQKQQRMG